MSALKRTVLAGGVVYPAGTEATDELRKKIPNPAHWGADEGPWVSGDADEDSGDDIDRLLADSHPNTLLLRDVVESLVARHLEDVEVPVADLIAEAQEAWGLLPSTPADQELDTSVATGGDADSAPVIPVDYDALDIDALKGEIDRRNEGRDDDAKLSKRGSRDTLAAALRDDDAKA